MVVTAVAAPGAHAGVLALRAGGSAADAVLTAALTNTALTLGTGMSYAGGASLVYYEAATGQGGVIGRA
jgi:gamma-glutamyltranspeptidase / glutathione hydrolase